MALALLVIGMVGGGLTVVAAVAMFALVLWQAPRQRDNQLMALFMAAIATWGACAFLARAATFLRTESGLFVLGTAVTILFAATLQQALVVSYAGVGGRWWARLSLALGLLGVGVSVAIIVADRSLSHRAVLVNGITQFRMRRVGYAVWATAATQCLVGLTVAWRHRQRRTRWLLPGTTVLAVGIFSAVTPLGRVAFPVLCAAVACVLFTRAILTEKLFSPLATANVELAEGRARLSALIEHTADSIWSVGLDHRATASNALFRQRFAEWTGHPLREGESMLDQLEPDARARWRGFHERVFRGERFVVELRYPTPDRAVDLEVWFNPIRDARGETTGAAVCARDVTERKRVDQLKDEFVAVVSHELRTPLTSIVGSLGLLQGGAGGALPPEATDLVEIMDRNAQRLLALIGDLLDVQKLESGAMRFAIRRVELGPILAQAVAEHREYAARLGVGIHLAAAPDAWIAADPDRLMQVLANLISNAAKFSPRGAEVTLGATRHDDGVCVSVRDHGPGIPAEFQARVFQKFAQADGSAIRSHGGSGLGLAITRALVERMGGSIRFETAPGEGTTFFVLLPEAPE